MYSIVKKPDGRYNCSVAIQDGVERFVAETWEQAEDWVKVTAKVMNGVKVKRKDLRAAFTEKSNPRRHKVNIARVTWLGCPVSIDLSDIVAVAKEPGFAKPTVSFTASGGAKMYSDMTIEEAEKLLGWA